MPEPEAEAASGDDVQARLLKLIAQTTAAPLAVVEVTADTGLLGRGLGFDSIEVLALVSAIEEEFEVTISDADLRPEHFATVGTLVEFVRGCLPP